MTLIDKDNLKANIIKRLGISGEEYLLPAEKAIWDVIAEEPPVQTEPLTDPEQAIDYLHKTGWLQSHDRVLTESKIVPPVQPKRKTGQWIDKSNGIEGAWNYCSVCGEQAIDLYDFCPNCGAKMEG